MSLTGPVAAATGDQLIVVGSVILASCPAPLFAPSARRLRRLAGPRPTRLRCNRFVT